jgi:XRE family transcriptional regulator of biofilm formation
MYIEVKMHDPQTFGKCVTKMRLRRKLSLEELAKKAGLSYQSLWRIEHGRHKEPGMYTAGRLAKALDCSLDRLIGLYEDDEGETCPTVAALA